MCESRTRWGSAEGLPETVGAAGHVLLAVVVIAIGHSLGIRFTVDGARPLIVVSVLLGLLWLSLARSSAPTERRFAASTAGLLLLISAAAAALPAQYVIERANCMRAWNDEILIRADLAMGIDVREVLSWTLSHPNVTLVLEATYRSFIMLTFVPIICAYCGLLPALAMRRYIWQFVAGVWATLLVLWTVPVTAPYVWWSYELPLRVSSAMTSQLDLIRGAGPVTFRFDELEGLVAMPSFHTIGALAVTVSVWRIPILGPALAVINAFLIAATVMLGIHYAVDVLAGVLIYVGVAFLGGGSYLSSSGLSSSGLSSSRERLRRSTPK
jgi:membrane-associated phospholipid phosphatase